MDAKLNVKFRKVIFKYVQKFKTDNMSFDFETYGQNTCICVVTDCIRLKGEDLTDDELRFIANRLGDLLSDYCDRPPHKMSSIFYDWIVNANPYCSLLLNGLNKNNCQHVLSSSQESNSDKLYTLLDMIFKEGIVFRQQLTKMLLASQDFLGEEQHSINFVEYPRYYIKTSNDKFYLVDFDEIKSRTDFTVYYKQYEVNGHLYEKHHRCNNNTYCNICDGGLSVCGVCGQVEGDLTTLCPGHKSYGNYDVPTNVYNGHDFVYGLWVANFRSCPRNADEELCNFYAIRSMLAKGYKLNVEDLQIIVDYYRGRGLGWRDETLSNLTLQDLVTESSSCDMFIRDMLNYPNKIKLGSKCTKAIISGSLLEVYKNDIVTLLLNSYDDVFRLSTDCKDYDVQYIIEKAKLSYSCILIYINSLEDMYLAKSIIDVSNDLNIYFFTTDYVDELKLFVSNYKEFIFE